MRANSLKIYIKILTSSPKKTTPRVSAVLHKFLFSLKAALSSRILLALWSGGYTCTPCIGLLRTCFALLGFWCAPDKTKDNFQVLARAMSKNRRVLLNCCTYELLSLTWCLMRSFSYVLGRGTTDLPIYIYTVIYIYVNIYHTTYVYI